MSAGLLCLVDRANRWSFPTRVRWLRPTALRNIGPANLLRLHWPGVAWMLRRPHPLWMLMMRLRPALTVKRPWLVLLSVLPYLFRMMRGMM